MPSDVVTLAYVHDLEVAYSWHDSIVNLLMMDAANEQRIIRGGYIPMRCARSADLVEARNKAVLAFLERDSDWLFFVDTDMGLRPDTVERLLASADPKERPIVGALCFAQREMKRDGMSGFLTAPRFTILDYVDIDGKGSRFIGRSNYPVNSLVQCAGTGAACILIHRSVLEAIQEKYGPTWYNRVGGEDGTRLGEDISFCVRASALGFPIYVDTSVKTSHLKNLWLQEADFWRYAVAPPAKESVDIIVPVMRRPQNAEPFMRSLLASTGLATVHVMADSGDEETIDAWFAAGAEYVHRHDYGDRPGTFAEKVNKGFEETGKDNGWNYIAPWVFIVGDDVRFHSGWLDHAQAVAGDNKHVIGTNDLGNPRVTNGDHATHILLRRSYVDEVGASWDGPGKVAHEGYRHWFVDDEIVNAAKQRGAWAMSLGSMVEHLHPAWGKAQDDDVYKLGQKDSDKDRLLFEKRLTTNLGR